MSISVNGTQVCVNFTEQESLSFYAEKLNKECVLQAVANAVAARFAAIVSSQKDGDEGKIKKRIQQLITQWDEGKWTRGIAEPSWTSGDDKVLGVIAELKGQSVDGMKSILEVRAEELGMTLVTLIRKLKMTPEVQEGLGAAIVDFNII